jgi:hypothetical protein
VFCPDVSPVKQQVVDWKQWNGTAERQWGPVGMVGMLPCISEWMDLSYWSWPVVEGTCSELGQVEGGQGELAAHNTLVTAVELVAVAAAVVNAAMTNN